MDLAPYNGGVQLTSQADYASFAYTLSTQTLVKLQLILTGRHQYEYPTTRTFATGKATVFDNPGQAGPWSCCDSCAGVRFPMVQFRLTQTTNDDTGQFHLCDDCSTDLVAAIDEYLTTQHPPLPS